MSADATQKLNFEQLSITAVSLLRQRLFLHHHTTVKHELNANILTG